MQTVEANPLQGAMSGAERSRVREQMNRLLETHHFKNSRRYPALLRFIVEETLDGRGEFLKERLLGVRVFDRPADYDTATDPIVRVTIAEIRKRIAQYYHDEAHDAEIRIELLPGRYAPEFRPRRDGTAERVASIEGSDVGAPPSVSAPATPLLEPVVSTQNGAAASVTRPKSFYLLGLAALVLLGIVAIGGIRWLQPTAIEQLWSPILASQRSVLFCVPTEVGKNYPGTGTTQTVTGTPEGPPLRPVNRRTNAAGPTFMDHQSLGENVVYSDMLATLNIADILAIHHRDYQVRLNVATSLDDLRHGPAILVGGLDNQWTMRALNPLRFHFAGSDADRYWIQDATNPSRKDWSLDLKEQYQAVTRDYAIIARLHNDQTGQPEMIVAGIGMSGTAAGGEFVADEHRVQELRSRIGAGFKNRDFEVVLSTDVVNGIAGSPKILAVFVW